MIGWTYGTSPGISEEAYTTTLHRDLKSSTMGSANERSSTRRFGDLVPAAEQGGGLVVVLVEAQDPRNIGAVARAMSNLGVGDLRLVSPGGFNRDIARGVACWGASIVESAKTFSELRDAVADAQEVVGFASDSAHHRVPQMLLGEWVKESMEQPPHTSALVFGSEENGLRREHYPLCQYLVRIPSSTDNPSYNLAQAVLLTLYEVRRSERRYVGGESPEFPTSAHLDNLTDMMLRVATDVGFLNENSPHQISDLLVNVTRRGRLTTRELKILTGLFGQIHRKTKL
jgi:TrmH family RNA methyltransferase